MQERPVREHAVSVPRPTAAADPTTSRTLLPSLTGLRWVTALLIFGHHIMAVQYFSGDAATLWGQLFGPGSAGVTMFFVLSGFVLAWSHVPGQHPGEFWLRRVARVYPVHLVGVALAIVIGATILPVIATHTAPPLIADVFLVSAWNPWWWQAGNPVSWSLVCEAFFYLCFPLLIRILSRLPRRPPICPGRRSHRAPRSPSSGSRSSSGPWPRATGSGCRRV